MEIGYIWMFQIEVIKLKLSELILKVMKMRKKEFLKSLKAGFEINVITYLISKNDNIIFRLDIEDKVVNFAYVKV